MGSKQKIAEKLMYKMLEIKPNAKYFVDLFGGGGSMSFLAMQMGFNVVYNEINTEIVKFIDYILNRIENNERSKYGIFPEEFYNFIDRETFFKAIKENNVFSTFCKIVYSFSNMGNLYLFSKEREEWKRLLHNVIIFQDVNALKELKEKYSEFEFLKEIPKGETWNERRLDYKKILFAYRTDKYGVKDIRAMFPITHGLKLFNGNIDELMNSEWLKKKIQESSRYKKCLENWDNILIKFKNTERLQQLKHLQTLERLQTLEILENLQILANLENLQSLKNLPIKLYNLDYRDVIINTPINETIIYLDPPYRNKITYNKNTFDNNELDEWFKNNKYTCFMSEYQASHKCILEIEKRKLMNSKIRSEGMLIEKLFCNI